MNNTKKTERIIRKIAKREKKSVSEIKREIDLAILYGLNSTNPNAVRFWNNIEKEKNIPTSIEVITSLSTAVQKGSI